MPQMSLNYAAGRLFMLRREAMDTARLERLISTQSMAEARRALAEIGWGSADTDDPEALAQQRVKDAAAVVRELTTDQRVTDCFLLKYDTANLKMLIKSRCVGIPAERLSECGILPVDTLRHAVSAHSYEALPTHFRAAMEAIEKELQTDTDPLRMDVLLDQAMFAEVDERLRDARCQSATAYFTAKRDITNAITLLRVRRMGRDAAFLREVLLPGGTITAENWLSAYADPNRLPALLKPYGDRVVNAVRHAVQENGSLPALEKAMDDTLLETIQGQKYQYTNIEYIISYLLSAEREAAAVRLILAARANGFDEVSVRERLRDLYV